MFQMNTDNLRGTSLVQGHMADVAFLDEAVGVDVAAERAALKRERRTAVKERDLDRRSKRRDKRRNAY